MSHTTIPQKVRLQIWLRAAGRCQFRGCNDPLWRDELTMEEMNAAHLAHIIADSENGPRGHPILSEKLKADPSNIMLLCPTHHSLVDDKKKWKNYPVELLQEYKREHEERIEIVTGIQDNLKTHILLLGTRIGEHQAELDFHQACSAVIPQRYPVDNRGIIIDLVNTQINEEDREFWDVAIKYVDRELKRYLADDIGPSGKPINHLSIFALAPIPILIYLGKQLGDIRSAEVFQRHRSGDWSWKGVPNYPFDYMIDYPEFSDQPGSKIAVNLSLSGRIHTAEIEQTLGFQLPIYTIRIPNPKRDFLCAKEYLELFKNKWHQFLSEAREVYGAESEIYLFPAVPNAIAIEIGRALRPKVDPIIHIYNKSWDGFQFALTV